MKIAVPYENGMVFQHFGHTEQFKVYDVENGEITGSSVTAASGSGHGALAQLLSGLAGEVLICGGIGPGADAAVKALLAGTLAYNPEARCDHHAHGDHGSCGQHGCGGHGGGCRS